MGRGGEEGRRGEGRGEKRKGGDKKRSANSPISNIDWVIFSVVYTFSYIIKA